VLIAQRPTLTEEPVSERRSRFVLEPLEPGFGYTLGNSLRRTLLSSIPGAAVTSIRIDGVLHEFTTVPGVKEDVTDLILNLKELVVSSESDDPVVMYLRKQGPGAVTAADIAPPAGVEVHNPDLHIATLNGKGRLEIELTVERGRGYVSAVQNKQAGQEIGRIPVDSIYSPVLKVTYKVEATRVEQRTDFDRLVLDVETKPSTTPRDAVASAGKTLVGLFGLAQELNAEAEGIDIGPSPTDAALAADLALPIEEMDLTVRSYNCLKREGIHTVGELVSRSEADLLDIRNFGSKSIDEVKVKLHGMGLALKDSPPGFDPGQVASTYGTDEYGAVDFSAGAGDGDDDVQSFAETEKLEPERPGGGGPPPRRTTAGRAPATAAVPPRSARSRP
jgi:DNA-directed RNA polymerase subunit alpha